MTKIPLKQARDIRTIKCYVVYDYARKTIVTIKPRKWMAEKHIRPGTLIVELKGTYARPRSQP